MGVSSSVSAVIMAFNEKDTLEKVVREIHTVLDGLDRPFEIVIIDDGSSDETGVIADRLAHTYTKVRVVHHETNMGLGEVYRTGFTNAKGDFITFFPADGQFPADIIKQFVPLMNDMDMVLGYILDQKRPFLAQSLSAAERVLYGLLFGRMPRFQGVMMFRRVLLEDLELISTGRGWTVLMELIIRAQRGHYRMISVPTDFRPRIGSRSKVINVSALRENLRQALSLRRNFEKTQRKI